MIAIVKNNDNPVMTMFGGIACVPSAVRVMPSTTAILVKLVMVMIIAGAKLRAVRRKMILIDDETLPSDESSAPATLIDKSGSPASAANAVEAAKKAAAAAMNAARP